MIFFFIIGLVNLSNSGGKNFEAGVYSYDKFKKKKITFGYTYRLLRKKKNRKLNMVVYFFLSKTQFLGFVDCVNMTYFLRGSDLL